jgi:hypothetical protein
MDLNGFGKIISAIKHKFLYALMDEFYSIRTLEPMRMNDVTPKTKPLSKNPIIRGTFFTTESLQNLL